MYVGRTPDACVSLFRESAEGLARYASGESGL